MGELVTPDELRREIYDRLAVLIRRPNTASARQVARERVREILSSFVARLDVTSVKLHGDSMLTVTIAVTPPERVLMPPYRVSIDTLRLRERAADAIPRPELRGLGCQKSDACGGTLHLPGCPLLADGVNNYCPARFKVNDAPCEEKYGHELPHRGAGIAWLDELSAHPGVESQISHELYDPIDGDFYNGPLGVPYIDPDAGTIRTDTSDHCGAPKACACTAERARDEHQAIVWAVGNPMACVYLPNHVGRHGDGNGHWWYSGGCLCPEGVIADQGDEIPRGDHRFDCVLHPSCKSRLDTFRRMGKTLMAGFDAGSCSGVCSCEKWPAPHYHDGDSTYGPGIIETLVAKASAAVGAMPNTADPAALAEFTKRWNEAMHGAVEEWGVPMLLTADEHARGDHLEESAPVWVDVPACRVLRVPVVEFYRSKFWLHWNKKGDEIKGNEIDFSHDADPNDRVVYRAQRVRDGRMFRVAIFGESVLIASPDTASVCLVEL